MKKSPAVTPETFQRLYQLLDSELTPDAERAMLEEIKNNPAYREFLSREEAFREFIRSRIHRKKVSPALVQSIKDKIHSSAQNGHIS